jgi:hypothetical protein
MPGWNNFQNLDDECDRSHDAVIRIYEDAGNVIETPEQTGKFKKW